MKISKKFKDFYNLVLATFVRANFNYKSKIGVARINSQGDFINNWG